jgi:hypothetical protein
MLLLSGDRVLRDYEVALGTNPTGPKRRNGDGRTPEGRYWLDSRSDRSDFHRSIISYPNEAISRSRGGIAPGGNVDPRTSQWWELGRRRAPRLRLDERLHRSDRRRDGRNLGARR